MARRLLLAVALFATNCAAAGRVPARESLAPVLSSDVLAIHQYFYFYGEFPRQLAAIDAEIALAERTVALYRARVEGYQPFRSFGRYAATYMADQTAQLDLLAATIRLECLRRQRDDLWRQRQIFAALLIRPAP